MIDLIAFFKKRVIAQFDVDTTEHGSLIMYLDIKRRGNVLGKLSSALRFF